MTSKVPVVNNHWNNLPSWLQTNVMLYKDLTTDDDAKEVQPQLANMVSSVLAKSEVETYHTVLLDLDMNAALIPSSTPGHHHLMINKVLTHDQMDKLLRVLVEVGIVQKGILELQWEKYGYTALRLPGVKKESKSLSSGGPVNPILDEPTPEAIEALKKEAIEGLKKVVAANSKIEGQAKIEAENLQPKNMLDVSDDLFLKDSPTEAYNDTPQTDMLPISDTMTTFAQLAAVSKEYNLNILTTIEAWKQFNDSMPDQGPPPLGPEKELPF